MKSYTDLSQSKKLAEFLPLESADMRIGNYVGKSGKVDGTNVHYYLKGESFGAPEIIYAWSLTALMDVLDRGALFKTPKGWACQTYIEYKAITSDYYNNPIDACVAMIENLHEQNLL